MNSLIISFLPGLVKINSPKINIRAVIVLGKLYNCKGFLLGSFVQNISMLILIAILASLWEVGWYVLGPNPRIEQFIHAMTWSFSAATVGLQEKLGVHKRAPVH